MSGVDTVIHAAALKQVPAAEYNPFECIHTKCGAPRMSCDSDQTSQASDRTIHRQGFGPD